MAHDIDKVTLTYADSKHPRRIFFGIDGDRVKLDLSVEEAADLSERLREAVRVSGYELVARPRNEAPSKRQRAAALLSDSEIDGILDAVQS